MEYRGDYHPAFSPQEIWATVEEIKPVTRKAVSIDTEEDKLREMAEVYGLEIDFFETNPFGPGDPNTYAYISNSLSLIEDARDAEKEENQRFLGRLLGYPSCCIERYEEDYTQPNVENDRVRSIYRPSESFHPYNNVIYTFETRVNYAIDSDEMKKLNEIEGLDLYLNCHLPCSFDCNQSRENAEELMSSLESQEPEMASRLKDVLARPVLFFSDFRWVSFEGEADGDEIRYSSVVEPRSLVDSTPFEKGDRIQKTGDEVRILDGEEEMERIETDPEPLILPFGDEKR